MDYKALAEDAIEVAKNVHDSHASRGWTNRAQVYATMHLAEQQRIGNLIAFMVQYATSPDDNANFIKYHEKSFAEITKALGI